MTTSGLYGQSTNVGGTYFEWFIFYQTATIPSTPIGGSWNFTTNIGIPPSPWNNTPPNITATPTWVSIAIVDSRNPSTFTWSTPVVWATGGAGSGTVTVVGVTSANGLGGAVATSTTTPNITLTTSVNGIAKGNGSAFSAAASGTDYSAGTSALGTGIVKTTTGTGALSVAVAGDFPTLNQNTTGTASNVTGTVAVANGGTGSTTAANALIALGERTSATGSIVTPSGTTLQRDSSPSAGYIRFNTSLPGFEGYNGTAWTAVGGGATGGGSDTIFQLNNTTMTTSYTLPTGKNAMVVGPLTINSGATLTIPSGQRLVVI